MISLVRTASRGGLANVTRFLVRRVLHPRRGLGSHGRPLPRVRPDGRVFAVVRARVLNGQIGVGVLDQRTNAFLIERNVAPSPGMADIYLPVGSPDRAGALIIRNTAEGGTRSEILIEDVGLVIASESARK